MTDTPSPLTRCALDAIGPNPQDIATAVRLLQALAQPEPVGPTDEELDSVFHEHCWTEDDLMDHDDFVKAARALLARWGHPTPTPIPVSEGLPEAKDCDAEGRCWWGYPELPTQARNEWRLAPEADRWGSELAWLPAHALPLPAAPGEGQ